MLVPIIMMSSRVLLTLFNVVVVLNYCHSQVSDDGITISLGDRVIPNHGLVATEDIGVDPTGMNLTVGLKCSTIYSGCCTDCDLTGLTDDALLRVEKGKDRSGVGSWKYAHNKNYVSRQIDQPDYVFGVTRIGRAVYLFRNSDGDINLVNGIWRCVIPDSSGVEQTKYIGIYFSNQMTNNGTLSVGSTGTIQFIMVSEDSVVFNLTFRTTGGPATYVTWTRDGVNISSLGDNCYTPSQTVVSNGGFYTAGDYDNILTVSGRLSGVYGVSVTNDRTTTPLSSSIAILDYPQDVLTSGSATQSPTDGDITISWTVSNSSVVSRIFDGYEIQYRQCPLGERNSCGGSQVIVIISDTTTSHYELTNVILWSMYEFSITLVNKSNHHYFPGVSGLRIHGIQVTTRESGGTLPSSSTTTITGLTTVIVIQFLALVICGVVITILAYKMKILHDHLKCMQLQGAMSTSPTKKGNQGDAIYEEPDMLTPTPALAIELEVCPAYKLTKID